MIKDGIGGVNTKTGLEFELQTDLKEIISRLKNYKVKNCDFDTSRKNGKVVKGKKLRSEEKTARWLVLYKQEEVARIFRKDGLYRYFDEIDGYDYTKIISSKLLPDDAIFVIEKNTVFIIEKKTQSGSGSVDEKLQTCDLN